MALHGLRPDDPAKLGPYELRGRLGAGGMGVVYLGFGADGQAVAVKTLPGSASADSRERMRREARLLGSVDFPRVAGLVAADTDAGTPWLALAYISGPSLLEATKPLRDAPLRQFAHGLAEALAALHEVGITHRDVKPANVILTFDGPVLVDLGIARTEDMATMTQAGTVIGSAGWMSPEQLKGTAEGPASDVWGWGAVLVYAATGRAPFGEGALEALAWRIQSQEPDLDGVPDWLLPAVKGALAKQTAIRPAARNLFSGSGSPSSTPPIAAARAAAPPPPARPAPRPPAAPTRVGTGPQTPPHAAPPVRHPMGTATAPPYRTSPAPAPPPYRPPHHVPVPAYRPPAPPAARRRHTGVFIAVGAVVLIGVLALVAGILATGKDPKLAAPANFTANTTPTGVNLNWDAVKSAAHYDVFRDDTVLASGVSGTSYTDPGGETAPHSYYVRAVSTGGKQGDRSPSVPTRPDTSLDTSSPSPSALSTTALSTADQALADRLPPEVADTSDCTHYTGFTNAATIASVSCATSTTSTGGTRPTRVFAYQDRSAAAFKTHFATVVKTFNPSSSDCNKPPAKTTWFFDSDKNTIVGSLLCYTDSKVKKPTIQWTYDADAIAILAVAKDQDAAGLTSWWVAAGLRLN